MTAIRRSECVSAGFRGQLAITISEQGTTTTVSLRGEWDVAEAPVIRRTIGDVLERSPTHVVLDLTGLSFIDSTGVHGVVELHKRSERLGVHLVIVPGPRTVQHVFALVGLGKVLPFLPANRAAEPRAPAAHALRATGYGGYLSRLPTAPAAERFGGRRR